MQRGKSDIIEEFFEQIEDDNGKKAIEMSGNVKIEVSQLMKVLANSNTDAYDALKKFENFLSTLKPNARNIKGKCRQHRNNYHQLILPSLQVK